MADVVGVRWTPIEGDVRVYQHGRAITVDGYGDYEIRDEKNAIVATRRRARTDDIELMWSDDA